MRVTFTPPSGATAEELYEWAQGLCEMLNLALSSRSNQTNTKEDTD